MYIYDKEGLHRASKDTIPQDYIQIDVMSDLHLDFYIKSGNLKLETGNFISRLRKEMEVKNDEVVIVGGDISHRNKQSQEFLTQLSELWKYVLVIPGNHDWYFPRHNKDRYKELIHSLEDVKNIIFLMDKVEIFTYQDVKIAGTSMIYNLTEYKDYAMWNAIMSDSQFVTREFINERNKRDVNYYNRVINDVDIFVSHVPIVNLDGKSTTENLFLNMDVKPQEKVLYLSGHTHKPRHSIGRDTVYNAINVSYGYPSETLDNSKAIYTLLVPRNS